MPKRKRDNTITLFTSKRFKSDIMFQKKRTVSRARRSGKRSFTGKVNRIIDKRIETKFACNPLSATDILTNPLFDEITNIGQGATEGTRVGVRINPTYMELKLIFNAPGSTNMATGGFLRLMVVQTKGDPLAVGDMPEFAGDCPDFDQYNVWFDELVQISTMGGTLASANPAGHVWQYSKVLKRSAGVKQDITYDGSAGAAQSGGIYIYAVSTNADIDVDRGYALLKYKDG